MSFAILLLLGVALSPAETFPVIHEKTAWFDGEGTVEISEDGIAFSAENKERSRRWDWLDIQHFDRVSETEFVIRSYEDRALLLGRDRSWRFLITDGKLSDALFARIRERLARPVTDRVVRERGRAEYSLPAKHLHPLGGCEGELRFSAEGVAYATEHATHARAWRIGTELVSVWSADPYQFEVHAREPAGVHRFQLKEPLDRAFYEELKRRLFDAGY